jgi:hypothetical protein
MRPKLRSVAELEQAAGIQRTTAPAPTRRDVFELTKKRLGRFWGRPRPPHSLR